MSEATLVTGGAGDVQGGAHSANGGADQAETNPARRAHDGILTELKAERTKRRELEERMSAIETERLLGEGKLKEYAESLKAKADKLENELKSVKHTYAFTTVKSQIERKAQELGCIDSDLLLKAIDLDQIQVDEAFKVDTQSLGEVLESVRKSKPYLFKQEGQKFRDTTPGTSVGGKPDLSKMTKQQLVEFAKNNGF
jgi:hypothetical protein